MLLVSARVYADHLQRPTATRIASISRLSPLSVAVVPSSSTCSAERWSQLNAVRGSLLFAESGLHSASATEAVIAHWRNRRIGYRNAVVCMVGRVDDDTTIRRPMHVNITSDDVGVWGLREASL